MGVIDKQTNLEDLLLSQWILEKEKWIYFQNSNNVTWEITTKVITKVLWIFSKENYINKKLTVQEIFKETNEDLIPLWKSDQVFLSNYFLEKESIVNYKWDIDEITPETYAFNLNKYTKYLIKNYSWNTEFDKEIKEIMIIDAEKRHIKFKEVIDNEIKEVEYKKSVLEMDLDILKLKKDSKYLWNITVETDIFNRSEYLYEQWCGYKESLKDISLFKTEKEYYKKDWIYYEVISEFSRKIITYPDYLEEYSCWTVRFFEWKTSDFKRKVINSYIKEINLSDIPTLVNK